MRALITLMCAAVAAQGCKSTPEDEARLWQRKVEAAAKWSGKHPGLAAAIEQRLSEARTQLAEAEKATDQAARLAGMKRANAHLGAIVDTLDRHERLVREVAALAADRDVRSLPDGDVSRYVRQANKAVVDTREMIAHAAPEDAVDAVRILQNAVTRLEAAAQNLRRLRARAREDRSRRGAPQGGT